MQKLIQYVQSVISKSGGEWGIVFEDLQTGETWENHAEKVFTPASVMKLPVMAAIFSKAHQDELDLSDTITLQQDDMVGGSGVLQHMTPGTEISLDDLITLMIIQSDNTATNILIDLASTASINQLMEKIGMHHSVINRKLMRSDTDIPPNQMTSGDTAIFLQKLYEGKIISEEASTQMIDIMKKQQIQDSLPGKLQYLPDSQYNWQLAHKTGWIPGYRHDVGIFYVREQAFIASIFSKGIDDFVSSQAFADIGMEIFNYMTEKQENNVKTGSVN